MSPNDKSVVEKATARPWEALRKLAEAATPGPWDTLSGNVVRAIKGDFAVPLFESRAPIDWHKKKNLTHKVMCDAYAHEVSNATYIAAANPSAVLELLNSYQRMREALELASNTIRAIAAAKRPESGLYKTLQDRASRIDAALRAPVQGEESEIASATAQIEAGTAKKVEDIDNYSPTDPAPAQDAVERATKIIFDRKCGFREWEDCEGDIAALSRAGLLQSWKTPEGWQLVPKEPDERMIDAAQWSGHEGTKTEIASDYRAMLAAAPATDGDKG